MSFAQLLMLATALLCGLGPVWNWTAGAGLGLPRMPWNATGVALAFAYFLVQLWYLIAGVLDVGDLFMFDIFTIAMIFCKAVARSPDRKFGNGWQQFQCMIETVTVHDRAILTIYPLVWIAYVAQISEHSRWWLLWLASMIQFLIAGTEAYSEWRKAKAPFDEPDIPSSGVLFVAARAGRWST